MFKNMKKHVSRVVAATMLFSSVFSSTSFAAVKYEAESYAQSEVDVVPEGALKFTVDAPSKVKADEEFTVTFNVANNTEGFAAFAFTVGYDPTLVKPVVKVLI